ncbi:MAG: hypothetical protein AB9919_06910 [Geobacteraceae bacterium]
MQKEKTKSILAILAFVGVLACLIGLFFAQLPEGARDIILILVGVMATLVKDVYGYYFGSSEGSLRKTELLFGGNNEARADAAPDPAGP